MSSINKNTIMIILMTLITLNLFSQKHISMKVYIKPFTIFEMDADIGKPEGYLNENYTRVNSSYSTITSHEITINKFINVFFEKPEQQNNPSFKIKPTFKESNKYEVKYFEPDMVIDFFYYDTKAMIIQINKWGYFVCNYKVYEVDKTIMDLFKDYFPPEIVTWF